MQEATNASYFYLTFTEPGNTHFGYITYSIDKKIAYLEAIYLKKKYRGKGLGKEALATLEIELRKIGITCIKLYVFAHNNAALSCYKNMGYVIENTYFNNENLVGFHMKKEIVKELS